MEKLSSYHQQKVEAAQRHLCSGDVSEGNFPSSLTDELEKVWKLPVLFSSFRHSKLDPSSQFRVGDNILYALKEGVRVPFDLHHTVWETHPRGLGTVNLAYPAGEQFEVIDLSGLLPNFTQWRPFGSVLTDLETILNSNNWALAKKQLAGRSSFNSAQLFRALQAIDEIDDNYRHLHQKLSQDKSITTYALEAERFLAGSAGLEQRVGEATAYSESSFKDKINQSLAAIDQELSLEKVLEKAVDDRTAANLFVGGDTDTLMRIGYSVKKHQFQVTESNSRTNKKTVDRKAVDKSELFRLLVNGDVIAAGIPAFIALIAASAVRPIAHLGSEYGTALPVASSLDIKNMSGYRQIVDDFKDCWSPVQVENQAFRLTLTTMALWRATHQLDWNNLINKSISLGEPIKIKDLNHVC